LNVPKNSKFSELAGLLIIKYKRKNA